MLAVEVVKEQVRGWIDKKLLEEQDYFVVDIKMPGVNRLQVFMDGDRGITIDKCAEWSRYIEAFLDEEKIIGERYVLEVSSPGMDKPLKVLRQYAKRLGSEVNVVTTSGERHDGILKYVSEEKVIIEKIIKKKSKVISSKEYEIPFAEIKRTTLNF